MRLWSIHPKYLDPKGLVAVWREGLLAQAVLKGKTKGYKNHPQLNRFKGCKNPLEAICAYLKEIASEAEKRGYNFSKEKLGCKGSNIVQKIRVKKGQLEYEFAHLKNKLRKRDRRWLAKIENIKMIEPHPLFKATKGGIESWEKIKKSAE